MTREEFENYMKEKHALYRCYDNAVDNADWEEAEMLSNMIDSINEILEEEKMAIWEEF